MIIDFKTGRELKNTPFGLLDKESTEQSLADFFAWVNSEGAAKQLSEWEVSDVRDN